MPAPSSSANYYDILEVSQTASPEVIRAAYRSLMQRYHPDKNPGNKEAADRAVLVAQAYDTLSDAERRAEYDQSLREQSGIIYDSYGSYSAYDNAGTSASSSSAHRYANNHYHTERAHVYAEPARKRSSFIFLFCACALIIAVFWVLIITVRQLAIRGPRDPAHTAQTAASASEAVPRNAPPARRRLRPLQATPQQLREPVLPRQETAPETAETPREQRIVRREIPALISNLSIALTNPQNPEDATAYRLEIPVIGVRLGGKQTASAYDHLNNMAAPIRQALEARLKTADYDSLMTFNGEAYLARQIFDTITQATSLPACASSRPDVDTCYGLAGISLPESYVVK